MRKVPYWTSDTPLTQSLRELSWAFYQHPASGWEKEWAGNSDKDVCELKADSTVCLRVTVWARWLSKASQGTVVGERVGVESPETRAATEATCLLPGEYRGLGEIASFILKLQMRV